MPYFLSRFSCISYSICAPLVHEVHTDAIHILKVFFPDCLCVNKFLPREPIFSIASVFCTCKAKTHMRMSNNAVEVQRYTLITPAAIAETPNLCHILFAVYASAF